MNRLFITLVGASIAALVLAAGCGSWLFLQSWKDGKRLERQNRELKASLEASRIRLENFCEYPAEALCNIEEPHGSVSSAMSSLSAPSPAMPEPAHAASAGTLSPRTENIPADENASADKPLPSDTKASVNDNTAVEQEPEKDSDPQSKNMKTNTVPPLPENDGASQLKNLDSAVDSGPSAPAAPSAKKKKTWTSMDLKRNTMRLHIAGEGASLTGRGQLLSDPLRYEVTLDGLWNISSRQVRTSLIRDMQTAIREGNTVLTFPLSKEPLTCSVRQDDKRTVTIIIQ